MIVADQDHIRRMQGRVNLLGVQKRIVGAERLAELANIFAAAVRILGADLAFHSCQRVQLRGAAAGPQIDRGCHKPASSSSLRTALTSYSATPYAPNFGATRLVGGDLPNSPPQNLTIATTGASGSVFLRQMLLAVERDARVQTVNFIASDSGLRVLAEELGIKGRSNLVRQILAGRETKASARGANTSAKIKI